MLFQAPVLNQAITLLSIGAMTLFMMMSLVSIVANKLKSGGLVDLFWALGFSVLMAIYLGYSQGYPQRRLILAAMVIFASLRLFFHLLKRYIHEFPKEDARYAKLREEWKEKGASETAIGWGYFAIFQAQGFLMLVLSSMFTVVLLNSRSFLSGWEWAGLAVWIVGFIGEAIADNQLHTFKTHPGNKGKVCDTGLWHYSRHPNYFFEWLTWVSYFIFALGSPYGWIGVIAPVLMLFFLIKVTGVAASEEQSLKSKGEAYRQYQESTSPFVPWFKLKPESTL